MRTRNALLMSVVLLVCSGAAASAQIVLSPSSLPAATQGQFYSQSVTASGGTGPYTYAVTSGSLPTGLNLNTNTGAITGTPTVQGVSNFTITATDATTATGQRSYSLAVGTFSLTLLPTTLPNGSQGSAYSQTITAVGGTAPYTFTISSGSLPTGLSLDTGGDIAGTPTVGGSYGFVVQAADANGNTGFRPYTINVAANSLTINPASLPNASQGVAYSQNITASGGAAPYTFSVTSGSLPSGLSLSSGGSLSGTPTVNGAFNFTVRGVDNNGDFGTRAYTLNVGGNTLVINPTSLPNGTTTVPYSQTVTASGGTAPYTYSVASGALPNGLALNTSTGDITGTPTATGTFNFTIGAIDNVSNTGSRAYTVHIGSASLTVNPASLPNGTVGWAYNQIVSASGGTAPYTYSISAGALPNGLSLNTSSGAITGTAGAAGT